MTVTVRIAAATAQSFTTLYNDQGSSADADVQFWRPAPETGGNLAFLPAGDVCESSPSDWIYGSNPPLGQVLLLAVGSNGNEVANPISFDLLWQDTGSGANLNGAIWAMNPPAGYTALGQCCTFSTSGPPPVPDPRSITACCPRW